MTQDKGTLLHDYLLSNLTLSLRTGGSCRSPHHRPHFPAPVLPVGHPHHLHPDPENNYTNTLNKSLSVAAILGPSLLRSACLLDITGRVLVGLDGKKAKLGAVCVTAVVEVLQQQPGLTGVYLANILADLR